MRLVFITFISVDCFLHYLIESDENVIINIGGNDYELEKGRHFFSKNIFVYQECKLKKWSSVIKY